jgi:hypothetical protein
MLFPEELPDDNSKLSELSITLPCVPFRIETVQNYEDQLLRYLEAEGYVPDNGLSFLRTARIDSTTYFIWSFESCGQSCYATVAEGPGGASLGCAENSWRLTPEQYVVGDFFHRF